MPWQQHARCDASRSHDRRDADGPPLANAATARLGLRPSGAASALAGRDLARGLGQNVEQVADHAEVDQLEDRRLLVLVDRDDRLGGLHAGPVLDRTGDAAGDIELRADLLAGLADLRGVRVPPGVDCCAAGTDGGTERVGEGLDLGEVATRAPATGDDDRGLGELRTAGALARLDCADPRTGGERRGCLLYTSPSPRDRTRSRMPSSA